MDSRSALINFANKYDAVGAALVELRVAADSVEYATALDPDAAHLAPLAAQVP